MGHKFPESFFVDNKDVVEQVDMAAIAERVKGVEFGQDLIVRLGSRHAPVQLDDVAKLAIERATARELDADVEIILELQEIEARGGAPRDVGLPHRRLKNALLGPAPPSSDEILHDLLGFSENLEVRAAVNVWRRSDIGAADHDRPPPRAAHLDDAKGIGLLN